MKIFLTTIAMSVLTLGAAGAVGVFTPVGTAKVNLDAIVQATTFQQVGGKTNQSATSTNITRMYKSTISQTSFNNADLLSLIANSFNINTNFPPGSQVGMRFGSLFVVDSTGTNVIFTPTGVISFQFQQGFMPETETVVTTEKASGTQLSGSLNETFIGNVTMNYDDTANPTTDGKHTKFSFSGFYEVKASQNLKSRVVKATITFQGTGGGTVRDVITILTGTISSKASGVNAPT